jgi:hypothetical protein
LAGRLEKYQAQLRQGRRDAVASVSTWPDRAHARLEDAQKYGSGLVFHRFRLFSIIVGTIAAVLIMAAAWKVILGFVGGGGPRVHTAARRATFGPTGTHGHRNAA